MGLTSFNPNMPKTFARFTALLLVLSIASESFAGSLTRANSRQHVGIESRAVEFLYRQEAMACVALPVHRIMAGRKFFSGLYEEVRAWTLGILLGPTLGIGVSIAPLYRKRADTWKLGDQEPKVDVSQVLIYLDKQFRERTNSSYTISVQGLADEFDVSRNTMRKYMPQIIAAAQLHSNGSLAAAANAWREDREQKEGILTAAQVAAAVSEAVQKNPKRFPSLRILAKKLKHDANKTIAPLMKNAIKLLLKDADEGVKALIAKRRKPRPPLTKAQIRQRGRGIRNAKAFIKGYVERGEIIPLTQEDGAVKFGISTTQFNILVAQQPGAKTVGSKGIPRKVQATPSEGNSQSLGILPHFKGLHRWLARYGKEWIVEDYVAPIIEETLRSLGLSAWRFARLHDEVMDPSIEGPDQWTLRTPEHERTLHYLAEKVSDQAFNTAYDLYRERWLWGGSLAGWLVGTIDRIIAHQQFNRDMKDPGKSLPADLTARALGMSQPQKPEILWRIPKGPIRDLIEPSLAASSVRKFRVEAKSGPPGLQIMADKSVLITLPDEMISKPESHRDELKAFLAPLETKELFAIDLDHATRDISLFQESPEIAVVKAIAHMYFVQPAVIHALRHSGHFEGMDMAELQQIVVRLNFTYQEPETDSARRALAISVTATDVDNKEKIAHEIRVSIWKALNVQPFELEDHLTEQGRYRLGPEAIATIRRLASWKTKEWTGTDFDRLHVQGRSMTFELPGKKIIAGHPYDVVAVLKGTLSFDVLPAQMTPYTQGRSVFADESGTYQYAGYDPDGAMRLSTIQEEGAALADPHLQRWNAVGSEYCGYFLYKGLTFEGEPVGFSVQLRPKRQKERFQAQWHRDFVRLALTPGSFNYSFHQFTQAFAQLGALVSMLHDDVRRTWGWPRLDNAIVPDKHSQGLLILMHDFEDSVFLPSRSSAQAVAHRLLDLGRFVTHLHGDLPEAISGINNVSSISLRLLREFITNYFYQYEPHRPFILRALQGTGLSTGPSIFAWVTGILCIYDLGHYFPVATITHPIVELLKELEQAQRPGENRHEEDRGGDLDIKEQVLALLEELRAGDPSAERRLYREQGYRLWREDPEEEHTLRVCGLDLTINIMQIPALLRIPATLLRIIHSQGRQGDVIWRPVFNRLQSLWGIEFVGRGDGLDMDLAEDLFYGEEFYHTSDGLLEHDGRREITALSTGEMTRSPVKTGSLVQFIVWQTDGENIRWHRPEGLANPSPHLWDRSNGDAAHQLLLAA